MLSQVAGHRWPATPTHYGEKHEALQRMRTTYLKEGSCLSSLWQDKASSWLFSRLSVANGPRFPSYPSGVDILRIINQGKLEARHI